MPHTKYIKWASDFLGLPLESTKMISSPTNVVYQLQNGENVWFLKIGPNLSKEYQKLNWLSGSVSVPKVVTYLDDTQNQILLQTAILGSNLYELSKVWTKTEIIVKYAQALKYLHQVQIKDSELESSELGQVLTHGDACLPNILFDCEGDLTGFIDIGDAKLGNPEIDLSAAIWSLQFNFGSGYGLDFLKAYGIENPTDELVSKLWSQYNNWIPLKT